MSQSPVFERTPGWLNLSLSSGLTAGANLVLGRNASPALLRLARDGWLGLAKLVDPQHTESYPEEDPPQPPPARHHRSAPVCQVNSAGDAFPPHASQGLAVQRELALLQGAGHYRYVGQQMFARRVKPFARVEFAGQIIAVFLANLLKTSLIL